MRPLMVVSGPGGRQQQYVGNIRSKPIDPSNARMCAFHEKWEQVNFPRKVTAFFPRKDNTTIKSMTVRPKNWKEILL